MGRGDHHGEVRFAAGAGEGRRHVGFLAIGGFHPEDEHVLSHPALVAAQVGADAQGEAFFAEQHVAAVIRAHRNDGVVLREMGDKAAVGMEVEHAVQAAVEIVRIPQLFQGHLSHARHDAHAQDHVEGIGQFDADLGEGGACRTHEVGDDIHRAALHRAGAVSAELVIHGLGSHPVVGGPGIFLHLGADEGALLHARHVVGFGAMIITAGELLLIQSHENPLAHGLLRQRRPLRLRAVAPVDLVRLAELDLGFDPGDQGLVLSVPISERRLAHISEARSTQPEFNLNNRGLKASQFHCHIRSDLAR